MSNLAPSEAADLDLLRSLLRDIPDFPKPGILFRDITPIIGSPAGLRASVAAMIDQAPDDIDVIAGVETRGFLFGVPMALAMGVGFVPIRKPGKLPAAVYEESFDLEYGSSVLNIHQDALQPGQRVLLVDDLLATGGTLAAGAKLIQREEAIVAQVSVLIELAGLNGRAAVESVTDAPLSAVLTYEH